MLLNRKVMALDPGNSTGWVARVPVYDKEGVVVRNVLVGGTIGEDHTEVYKLLEDFKPDILVYETFQMYRGKAQKLIWNTFYPCEVIGVIKLWAMQNSRSCKLVGLQPSVKKYALSNSELELWKTVDRFGQPATEHLRDAVRLLRYFERNEK